MKIELTIARIIEMYAFLEKTFDTTPYLFTLSKRYHEFEGINFSTVTTMKLSFIKRQLNEIIGVVSEERIKLIESIGHSSDNQNYTIPKEKVEEYIKEFNNILLTKKSIEIDPLKLSDFENTKAPMELTDMLIDFLQA